MGKEDTVNPETELSRDASLRPMVHYLMAMSGSFWVRNTRWINLIS